MFTLTKTFDATTKRLDTEITALRTKVATLEKLTARITKLEALPARIAKVEALAVKATALEKRLDKLPEQMLSLETSRRLWPLGDYKTGG